jgi:hypothetical protein
VNHVVADSVTFHRASPFSVLRRRADAMVGGVVSLHSHPHLRYRLSARPRRNLHSLARATLRGGGHECAPPRLAGTGTSACALMWHHEALPLQVPVPPQHVAFRPPPIEKRSVVLTANSKTAMVHPARPAGAGNPLIKRKRAREESDDDDADAMDRGTAADTVQPHKRRVYAGGDAKAANLGKASNRNWKVSPPVRLNPSHCSLTRFPPNNSCAVGVPCVLCAVLALSTTHAECYT